MDEGGGDGRIKSAEQHHVNNSISPSSALLPRHDNDDCDSHNEVTVTAGEVPEPEVEMARPKAIDERQSMLHDSMVTVRLSEPPHLSANTSAINGKIPEIDPAEAVEQDERKEESPRITMIDEEGNQVENPQDLELGHGDSVHATAENLEEDAEEVNWEELQQTEDQEPRDESSDDSTALLLARLEQENNLLATNPKSGIVKPQPIIDTRQRESRPPSIQHLKRLVNGPTPSALRYSMIPAPPMTDLEFYAALVQDYTRTAQCLPTLLSKKIRNGIPPPLRGVVWQSMSGARDTLLEDQFDRLSRESSPYEGLIGKDLGRSFPGVEMFRDPEGNGQRMLGRVLKCFSLYDHKIGYCQGLGFLVGPLLMHMGEKQAFCVLVRLMEHYDLRACFLPNLSGLHVRIYQFQELLKQHLPNLSSHLDHLQIEPAYVSQWFLSFFAVTCPLPMLFRIYDVVFAEGASETIMRVALSLMRKNEEKLLACSELEDAMQMLLSRGLWDVYHYNADEFVNDFVGLTGIVTHDSLQALEMSYQDAQATNTSQASENVGSAATRFLGRLWAGSNTNTKSMSLSPGLTAPTRPMSLLLRSPSKQSLASTLNSIEGGGSELSSSTEITTMSRDSSNTDASSVRTPSSSFNSAAAIASKSNKDKNLHGQIEDLLTALSELQRNHALLATQLQREREEREEDKGAVRALLDGIRSKTEGADDVHLLEVPASEIKDTLRRLEEGNGESEDDTTIHEISRGSGVSPITVIESTASQSPTAYDLSTLLDTVESRFSANANRRSSMLTTKSQLRDELARAKEQLINEVSKTQEFSRRLDEQKQEIKNLQEEVRDGHTKMRAAHAEKQRLERQIHELRINGRKASIPTPTQEEEKSEWPTVRSSSGSSHTATAGGLRELRLGRTNSKNSKTPVFNKRTSSLNYGALVNFNKENENPAAAAVLPSPVIEEREGGNERQRGKDDKDIDALVLELVQAKTAKALAEQEAEEARAKLESFRKLLGGNGMSPEGSAVATVKGHRHSPSVITASMTGMGSYFSGVGGGGSSNKAVDDKDKAPATAPAASTSASNHIASGGGFWTGWGKRGASNGSGNGS